MRMRVTGAALAIAIAAASAVCLADQGALVQGTPGRSESVVRAETLGVLVAHPLTAGGSLVRAVTGNGYSRVRLSVGAKGVLPGEEVNGGMRFGPVGSEARGGYGVHRQAIGTIIALGESALTRTATVPGPIPFLSFENRTGHEVAITAPVQQITWHLISPGQLPRTSLMVPGEEMSSARGRTIGPFLRGQAPPGLSTAQAVEAGHRHGGLAIAAPLLLTSGVGGVASALSFNAVETQNADGFLQFAGAKPPEPTRCRALYAAIDALAQGNPTTAVHQAPLAGRTTAVAGLLEEAMRGAASPVLRRLFAAVNLIRNPLSGLRHPPQDLRVSLLPRRAVEWSKRF